MSLIERCRQLLFSPKTAWPDIAARPDEPAQVMLGHVAPLAALSALAAFVGMSLIGVGALGMRIRSPWPQGLSQMVLSVALTLVLIGVLAWLIRWFAPRFGGERNTAQAVKLAGYSATAGLLAGIVQILPALSVLAMVGGLYSIYLLYLGLPVLMKSRPEDSVKYTAVVLACGIVCGIGIGLLSALIAPSPTLGGLQRGFMAGPADVEVSTPLGRIRFDEAALEANARRIEDSAERARAAQARGDLPAQQQAAQESMQTAMDALSGMFGGQGAAGDPNAGAPGATADALMALAPGTLGGLGFSSRSSRTESFTGFAQIEVAYGESGGPGIVMELGHNRLLGSLVDMMPEERSETAQRVVHKRRDAATGGFVEEEHTRDGHGSRIEITLRNGVQLSLRGEGVDQDRLRRALGELPLVRLREL